MSDTILKIEASASGDASLSRRLSAELADGLADAGGRLIARDLSPGIEFVDAAWVAANTTPADERDEAQNARLRTSDALIEELKAADTLVIGTPIYNFGPPAVLKAWIDQVCRARVTFRYTESGPKGLLHGKRAFVIVTSGGTEVGGPIDFASGYLRHVLGFIGIHDVTIIDAGQVMARGDDAATGARAQFATILADAARAA